MPVDGEEMIEQAARVAAFIDSSYVVTYVPKIAINEGEAERTITVTSKRPGLIVQAKRRFLRLEK